MNNVNQFTSEFSKDFSIKNNSFKKGEISKVNNIKLLNSDFYKYISSNDSSEKKEEGNGFDEFYFFKKNNNNIISYYYKTAENLKNSVENKKYLSLMINSKNYIPKIRKSFLELNNNIINNYNDNEIYINNYHKLNNNCIYEFDNKKIYYNEQQIYFNNVYNNNGYTNQAFNLGINKINNDNINIISNNSNYLMEGKEKNLINGYLEQINNKYQKYNRNIINFPPFIPANLNNRQKNETSRDSSESLSNDKESDSTSAISEKREEENNCNDYSKSKKIKNCVKNMEKAEYLVEMFGRKGWICKLCNNFNYETRSKCNRCGIMKKPKKIIDLKQNMQHNDIKERNNKKGDWICINCKNLNYSFRTFCNRCKVPKINNYLNNINLFKNEEKNNFHKYANYSFSPSIVFFNNLPKAPYIYLGKIDE